MAARRDAIDLSVSFAGLRLKNPVIAASGTFGYGTEYRGLAAAFGAIVTKTVTAAPRAGNAPPRLCETRSGMLNSIGLANVGIEAFLRDKLPALAGCGTVVIANIAGNDVAEYGALARRLDDAPGVAAIEVNISCPNVKQGGAAFGADPAAAAAVTRAVKRATALPVIVKLSPNVSDIAPVARAVAAAGADALSLINTLFGMRIDIERRRPSLGNVTGGLSGPAIMPVALYHVHRACRAVGIPVIGLGGIATAADAVEFMLAGAAAVQIGTATFVDPAAVRSVARGIAGYCRRQGLSRAAEITGGLRC
ncbi:MAG: dihydroorotate dehydrogenase [Candidatus Edwardsbacteria bacterium]|jgi:dihydroorotate dehydrogenase (NAD+) catalytic subunit|nr:dihydroorotate dehydrogenase [Candidatus Edwardsbacteria bacterium]